MPIAMETFIQNLLLGYGWNLNLVHVLAMGASILFLFLASILVGLVFRFIAFRILLGVVSKTNTQWDDYLLTPVFFTRLTWLILSVTAYALLWVLVPQVSASFHYLRRFILVCITLSTTAALFCFLGNMVNAIQALHGENHIPVKSYSQVLKILIGLVASVLVIAFLADQSPLGILAGIGTMTAVLLLVFKDSLLGFLASLQISTQDMVKIGDWIEIPSQGIDGEIIDISLNVIKIRNWDKSVTSVPSYSLVSGSFKNWRPMKEAGGRRVKRAIPLDATSIRLLDKQLIDELSGWPQLRDWLSAEASERRSHTNLGAFRVYAQSYLDSHPGINQTMGRTVRQMENVGRGLPVEFIFFSNLTAGDGYEALLSEVFEHFYAILPRFGLRVFQEPTGHDYRNV
jgi:miniconductance mechanosensitive channel